MDIAGRQRIIIEVPEWPGVWALGDCALVPDRKSGKFCPPTAQHALREGKVVAENLLATIRGGRKKPFVFNSIGQVATIGRRTGVANIMGVNFSGFLAWWLWRTIYLSKLPRFEKNCVWPWIGRWTSSSPRTSCSSSPSARPRCHARNLATLLLIVPRPTTPRAGWSRHRQADTSTPISSRGRKMAVPKSPPSPSYPCMVSAYPIEILRSIS